jgi:hypothetical protein
VPRRTVFQMIPASGAEVFRVFHDYDRRLEWDTLLQAAYLTDGFSTAGLNATTTCKGRWLLGGLEVKTRYVSFRPPDVAAVKMVNRPPRSCRHSLRRFIIVTGLTVGPSWSTNTPSRPALPGCDGCCIPSWTNSSGSRRAGDCAGCASCSTISPAGEPGQKSARQTQLRAALPGQSTTRAWPPTCRCQC